VDAIPVEVSDTKLAAGVSAILLGHLGIHKFLLGYTATGLLMLLLTLLTCGGLSLVLWPIAIAEGLLYLNKSDEEFHRDYVVSRRRWF